MIKLLLTGAIIYGIYRFFIAPPAVEEGHTPPENRNNSHDDEYVDYEEVD